MAPNVRVFPDRRVLCGYPRCAFVFGRIVIEERIKLRAFVLDGHGWHRDANLAEFSQDERGKSGLGARRPKVTSITGDRTITPRYSPYPGDTLRCSRCDRLSLWPGHSSLL